MNVSAIGATNGIATGAALALPAELSVVIPCYNERTNVAPLIAALDATLEGVAWEAISSTTTAPTTRPPRLGVSRATIPACAVCAGSVGAVSPPR